MRRASTSTPPDRDIVAALVTPFMLRAVGLLMVAVAASAGCTAARQTTATARTSASTASSTEASASPAASPVTPTPSTAKESSVAQPGTFEDVHGWIAFRNGPYLVAVDPVDPTKRISFAASHGADPIGWSLDGRRLLLRPEPEPIPVFRGGMWWIGTNSSAPLDLFVLTSDGSRTRLTHGDGSGPRSGTWGSFSPDGRKVVYASSASRSPYIIDADGGQPRSLRAPCDPRLLCGEPLPEWAAWSPDGSRIAFADFWEDHPSYGHHAYTLSFLDPEAGRTLGGETNVAAAGLAWSPDGSQLAFWSVVPDEDADPTNATLGSGGDFPAQIFVINRDGSGLRQLTHVGDNRWPTWSPDGSRIAFARGQLTYKTAPDGSEAAFVRPGSRDVLTMASDGTHVRRVPGVSPQGAIAWNPL